MCTDKHNRRIDDERTAHNGIDFEFCICDCFDIIFFCHFIMWTWNIEPHRAKKPHSLDKSTSGNLNNNEKIWTVLYLTETIKVETTWDKTAWNKCERNVDWETILQKKNLSAHEKTASNFILWCVTGFPLISTQAAVCCVRKSSYKWT